MNQAATQSFLVPLLGMLGIIGIGQYFSMFVRNPILSFVFTGIVSVVFLFLFGYVVFVNESVWLFVLPTIVAGYVATWWRSKFWLATTKSRLQYAMPLVLPVAVFTMLAAAFIHHRATEFSDVEIYENNFVQYAKGALRDPTGPNTSQYGIIEIQFGTQAQRQQAAALYKDAVELYDGDLRVDQGIDPMPWSKKKTADYVAKNQPAISKVIEAGQIPVCAPFALTDTGMDWGGTWALMEMALVNSHHQIINGNLTAAKQSIDAFDCLRQRSGRSSATRRESGHYGLLIAWADHPDQKLPAIKSAIAQLEGSEARIRPTKIADGDTPLLLPFSIDQPLPEPIEYEDEKQGVEIRKLLLNDRHVYIPGFLHFTDYKINWNVGGQD